MSQLCGFRGCRNITPGDYSWQMCNTCYQIACEIEDSEIA